MKLTQLSAILAITLSGCAHTPLPSASVCIHVTPYSQAQQNALMSAYDNLPPDSPLRPAIQDLKRMRDEARAACP